MDADVMVRNTIHIEAITGKSTTIHLINNPLDWHQEPHVPYDIEPAERRKGRDPDSAAAAEVHQCLLRKVGVQLHLVDVWRNLRVAQQVRQ